MQMERSITSTNCVLSRNRFGLKIGNALKPANPRIKRLKVDALPIGTNGCEVYFLGEDAILVLGINKHLTFGIDQ